MASHWEIIAGGGQTASNTPKELWDNACKYFKWCDENPLPIKRLVTAGKLAGQKIGDDKIRPYSVKALCLHCGIDEWYLQEIRTSKQTDSDFYIVVSKILYIIYVQNYEMAVVGEYNAIFTAKILNIDKTELPTKAITVNVIQGLPTLSESESEVLEKLELEKRDFGKGDSKNPTEQL